MELKNIIQKPRLILFSLGMHGWLSFIPDKAYLELMFWANTGKHLNLKNPKTYNDKLQWLKLNDRNDGYKKLVDKYEAKDYIASKIGKEYVIPLLGVWNSFEEIDFDSLPNSFVLKCTHDSGGVVICKDKNTFNYSEAKTILSKHLKKNYYYLGREYPYKNIVPKIIAEEYMVDSDDEVLTDYKFFCFNGEPKIVYISKDKANNPTTDFFDMNFNWLPIRMRDDNSKEKPNKPEHFDEMKEIAARLSKGHKHLRVDFYLINQKVYVGELTFYHNSGFSLVKPDEWNIKMGNWIKL